MNSSSIVGRRLGKSVPILLLIALSFGGGRLLYGRIPSPRAGVEELLEQLDGTPTPKILVVFQLMDCAEARSELALWNDVHRRPDFSVVGLLLDASGDPEVDTEILSGAGIEFEVLRHIPAGTIRFVRSLGFTATPVILAFDKDGRLRFAGSSSEFSVSDIIERTLVAHFSEE